MSNIKVSGSASGTGEITIAAPVTNSSRTQTLPDATGTVLLDSAATVSGNLAFTGTGNRITGDFTNGSRPNRVMFQTSTADSPTRLGAIPSGTGTVSEFSLYNTSDPSNASNGQLLLNATEFRIANSITGTGTYVPMTFYNNGSEQMRLTTAGNFGIGTSSPSYKLDVTGNTRTTGYVAINTTPSSTAALRIGQAADQTLGTDYAVMFSGVGYTGGVALDATSMQIGQNSASRSLTFHSGTSFAERMRIDSSGNVGIGTSSPGAKLEIGSLGVFRMQTGSTVFNTTPTAGANDYLVWNTSNSGSGFAWNTNSTERVRITPGGDLLVNRTSTLGSAKFVVEADTTTANPMTVSNSRSTAATDYSILFYRNASLVGSVQTSLTATSYVTSSDYRLKENIQPMTGALAKVAALKPVTYKWKATGGEADGFIAHELAEVCPQAVTGEKDAVDSDGNPKYQGIDTSFLVATLAAAIKELKAEFDAYKATHP